MFLNQETFSSVIKNTPLISIDLIVRNNEGKILLGKRVNEPAKNFWFVPGGRVFKDEDLDTAFCRTLKEELNVNKKRKEVLFDKVYEHFYENNVFNEHFSTHYIVLAYTMKLDTIPEANTQQHAKYRWFEVEELLNSNTVHKYTKDYFR